MRKWGILAFVVLPMIEIALFVVIGGAIGLWLTLGIIFGTGLLGVNLLQRQRAVAPDKPALIQVGHQVWGILAAICLILPGFLTDIIGLLLLIRPVRSVLIGLISLKVLTTYSRFAQRPQGGDDQVLDGDYTDVTPPSVHPKTIEQTDQT
jgi:UPF0716 protein FxsA